MVFKVGVSVAYMATSLIVSQKKNHSMYKKLIDPRFEISEVAGLEYEIKVRV